MQTQHIQKNRQRVDAQTRRRQITETASLLFIECGFEGVTMADIAQSLNTSRPNIYVYFPSTKAILEEVLKEKTAHMLTKLDEYLRQHRQVDQVDLAHIIQLLLNEAELFLLLGSGGGKFFAERRLSVQQDIFQRLPAEMRQIVFSKHPLLVHLIAASFLGLITHYAGINYADQENHSKTDCQEVAALFQDFIVTGVHSFDGKKGQIPLLSQCQLVVSSD